MALPHRLPCRPQLRLYAEMGTALPFDLVLRLAGVTYVIGEQMPCMDLAGLLEIDLVEPLHKLGKHPLLMTHAWTHPGD